MKAALLLAVIVLTGCSEVSKKPDTRFESVREKVREICRDSGPNALQKTMAFMSDRSDAKREIAGEAVGFMDACNSIDRAMGEIQ